MKENVRLLPAVHEVKGNPQIFKWIEQRVVTAEQVTVFIQEVTQEVRTMLLEEQWSGDSSSSSLEAYIVNKVNDHLEKLHTFKLQRVINATGTILHTNLGRAKLSKEAIEQVVLTAENYSNLEYDLDNGKRGSRHDLIEETIKMVTGAEAAMVVNNNAAAVYLILKALAKGKEVIVSRGELVEIGGSFRVSSIMEESGATLVEVGTTNKTHLFDYERAITENTAMMMKVHTSNFKTVGFTASVSVDKLRQLREIHENVILYEDLGSGAIYDLRQHRIGEEPTVTEVLALGADLVSFSGDKLLGGPQAGIIAGKKELISRLKKHQLARVLRVDKMTLAALEATLKAYVKGESVVEELPTLKAVVEEVSVVQAKAEKFQQLVQEGEWSSSLVEGTSQIGGGTMPDVLLPTMLLEISNTQLTSQALFDKLRTSNPPVVARIKEDKVVLDFRTITEAEIPILAEVFSEVGKELVLKK